MIIANPIYFSVFHKIMENDRFAKLIIGAFLNRQIEELKLIPYELTQPKVNRIDYIAIFRNKTNEQQKVLVEIRLARYPLELDRVFAYLNEQCGKADRQYSNNIEIPIVTIYFVGMKFPEIESPCLKVEKEERIYTDLISNTVIDLKSDIVEKQTHDCFIVQAERITGQFKTRLDQVLSIFEQNNFADEVGIIVLVLCSLFLLSLNACGHAPSGLTNYLL